MQSTFSHTAHFAVEIAFYSVVGPVVTWLTLGRIGQWLRQKEKAERAARSHERHLASVTDASADAILSLNSHEVIRSWNRGAELIFGFSANEMVDQPLNRLLPPDLDQEDENARQAWHTDAEGVMRHYETVCVARGGRRVPVDITRTPLRDDSGAITGTSVILRDITQRKAYEAVLEEERARIVPSANPFGRIRERAKIILKNECKPADSLLSTAHTLPTRDAENASWRNRSAASRFLAKP